jgi:glycosyltransferase involved in cell wall biosynthesis
MKFSIITVCFNSAATIEATLASVAEQGWRDFEHILVDGGSTDGTLDRVRAWRGHALRVMSGPDRGIYDAMNKGVAAATGDAIGFLNSDDRYADDTVLATLADALVDADFAHGDLVFVDPTHRGILRYWKGGALDRRQLPYGSLPAHPTLYVRRPVFAAIGPFSLDYGSAGDIEWMIRLLSPAALRSAYIPRVLVQMDAGGVSNAGWRAHLRSSREVWRACAHLGVSPAPFVIGKALRKLPQWLHRSQPA